MEKLSQASKRSTQSSKMSTYLAILKYQRKNAIKLAVPVTELEKDSRKFVSSSIVNKKIFKDYFAPKKSNEKKSSDDWGISPKSYTTSDD
jgi:hypothetical protein